MDDASLMRAARALCRALGYVGSATYFDAPEGFDRRENVHVVKTAFGAIGIHSIFGLADGAVPGSFKPVVYVGVARHAAEADDLHRRVWTQGVVPLLILVTPDGFEVRNAFGPPSDGSEIIRAKGIDGGLPPSLDDLSARALTTSIFWKDRKVSRGDAIDSRLVEAIEDLNRYACREYPQLATKSGRALVNALVGKLVYLYVLIDRGLVDEAWLGDAIAAAGCKDTRFAGAAALRGVRSDHPEFGADEVWAALDAIDDAINGCVFPIAAAERPRIPAALIRFVHGVVRWGEEVAGRQSSFLDVSFQVLRTETISAIYERFLRVEDGDGQRADGAFYTPPYLADFVVARADAEWSLDAAARVVDAAAGSGVFLVSAYRRIMERNLPPGGRGSDVANEARRLLRRCIFGIEKNPQAANVCRFSLYMTMLDYVAGARIGCLGAIEDGEKLLPPLDGNIVVASAFSHPFGEERFTHVLGNPPWLRLKRRGSRRNVLPSPAPAVDEAVAVEDTALTEFMAGLDDDTPVMHGRLSDAFVWLATERLAAEDAVVGLVLPTTSLVGRQSERFATALASRMSVRSVANLSYLRYRLFAGARAPATIVVARGRRPEPSDLVTVYSPRLSSLPLGESGVVWALLVSQTDLRTVRGRDLRGDANGWFGPLMLGTQDRRTRDALRVATHRRDATVSAFLHHSRLRIMRGGNEEDTGVRFPKQPDKRGNLVPVNIMRLPDGPGPEVAEGYRPLFSGNVLLVPRSFKGVRVLEDAHAFNSTYYGIAFVDGTQDVEIFDRVETRGAMARTEALRNLQAFLGSGVVRYFSALYGATVLLDGARFERGDLLALPCPFESVADPAFRELSRSPDVDAAILDALGAGADLRRAVEDFLTFSEGYADAQLPDDAFAEADEGRIAIYADRLRRELATGFTDRFAPSVEVMERGGGVVTLRISFGSEGDRGGPDPTERVGTFVASSVVAFDPDARVARVRKSTARFAWMADQAVEDAGEIVRQVVAGRA